MQYRHQLALGVVAGLLATVAVGPFLERIVQVVLDPPPQHLELVLLGITDETLGRHLWALGLAVGSWLLMRGVAGRSKTY